MDSTARSKEKAHEKVKLEPYGMSLKKVLVIRNEGVPMEDVKRQQEVRIKREYMIPYTSQEDASWVDRGLSRRMRGYPLTDSEGDLVLQGAFAVVGVTTCQGGRMHMQALYSQGSRCYHGVVKRRQLGRVSIAIEVGLQVVRVVAILTRLASIVASYLGVSVDGSEPISSYEICFMGMGCASMEQ
eukprot:Gb_26116 [translate_table: standard]